MQVRIVSQAGLEQLVRPERLERLERLVVQYHQVGSQPYFEVRA
jgi:hypothetical protein